MNGRVNLQEDKKEELRRKVEEGSILRSVYLQTIEKKSKVVRKKSDLPNLSVNEEEEKSRLNWFDWLNEEVFYALNHVYGKDSKRFEIQMDTDATAIHSDTLRVLKLNMKLNPSPLIGRFSKKIKHKYNGVSLHTRVNTEMG